MEWKIIIFQQGKNHIANFMIEYNVLAMKAKTDDMYTIFLLKKNIQTMMPKSMVPDPEWFDRNKTKFEDW